jgi:hypothetical protein
LGEARKWDMHVHVETSLPTPKNVFATALLS